MASQADHIQTLRRQTKQAADKLEDAIRTASAAVETASPEKAGKSKKTLTKDSKKSSKKKKKKVNEYFKLMLDAKKKDLPSFTYKGSTYYRKKTKTGMVIYGKKK